MQDTEAIERLKRGDDAGLVTLVQRYQILAVRAAQLVTRERAMAEDVVQDAFVRLPKDIAGFDPSRPFAPWFLRTVVRDAVRAANKATHQEPLPGEDDAVAQAEILRLLGAQKGPDEHLQQEELRVAVRAALDRLSPSQRAVIVLRYYLDLDEAAMASILHCQPGTIKWHLNRARGRLAPLLRPIWSGRKG